MSSPILTFDFDLIFRSFFFTFWGLKGILGGQGKDMSAESVSLNLSTIINLAVK